MMGPVQIGLVAGDPADVVAEARAAEEAGFDLLGCGEHLFFHGPVPNAFVTLAAAAGATERIGLLSAITLLPLYPAALAAKLAVTLDQVSRGRFALGVGAGGENPAEFTAAGIDVATRFRRVDEGLRVIRALFAGGAVSIDGEFTTLDEQTLDPPPFTPGGPPIWLGGRKDGALRRAARHADVWLPYMVTPAMVRSGLARIAELAAEQGRAPATATLFVWAAVDPDGDRARRVGVEKVSAMYAQDFSPLADRYLLLGDPDTAVARLAEFAEAGVDRVLLAVAADGDDRRRVLDTLASELVPRVHAL
jgi:probable F420-dependent oxidoreductase